MAATGPAEEAGPEVDPLVPKAVTAAEILRKVRYDVEDDGEEDETEYVTALFEFDTLPEVQPAVVDEFLHELQVLMSSFEGFVRQDVIKMRQGDGSMKHTVVNTFDNYRDLRLWLASSERKVLIENRPFLRQGEFKESLQDGGEDGLDGLIDDLEIRPAPLARPPPKWKLAVIVWIVAWVYVVLIIETGVLAQVRKHTESAAIQQLALLVLIMPPLLYFLVPVATKILHGWLTMDRPHYQWEPMRTLDEGVQLFNRPPPVIDQEHLVLLEDRVQHLEGAVQRLRAREVKKILKTTKAMAPKSQESTTVAVDEEVDEAERLVSRSPAASLGLAISAWDVSFVSSDGTASSSDPRFYLDKLEEDIAATLSSHHASKSKHKHAHKSRAVTQVSHLHVKWEHSDDFKRLIDSYRKMQKERFPGFVALSLLHGKKEGLAPQEYVMICKYKSVDEMRAYATSDQRKLFYKKVKPWLESKAREVYEQERYMHDAFTEIFDIDGHMPATPPAIWKVLSLSTLSLELMIWPMGEHYAPWLKDLGIEPWWIRSLVQIFTSVFCNAFLGSPFWQFIFGGWLHKPYDPSNAVTCVLYKGFASMWIKVVLCILFTVVLGLLAGFGAFQVDED